MQIKKIIVGELDTNCYIIVNDKNEALIIDPGAEAKKIVRELTKYKVVGILVTHFHFDHIGALTELENKYQIKVNQHNTNFNYQVISTPGHTLDSISFYFPEINSIFVGDFIFQGTIGRTDLGGDDYLMSQSLRIFLNKFDDEIIIYPGHGNATTLLAERDNLLYYAKK